MQMTSTPKIKRNVKVSGISFAPHIWEQLEEEIAKQGHRNRSLVVEKALTSYFDRQNEQRRKVEQLLAQSEGVA